jgi:hypothetical protein
MRSGNTKSCGCLAADVRTKNGQTSMPEYRHWRSMIKRCSAPPSWKDYHSYGGRGIRVCQEWLDSFEAFAAHIGPRPSPRHSVDRIDNDRGYEPGNVRWATHSQQLRNTRRQHGGHSDAAKLCMQVFIDRGVRVTRLAAAFGVSSAFVRDNTVRPLPAERTG